MKVITTIFFILFSLLTIGCSTTRFQGTEIRDRLTQTPELATHNITIDEPVPGLVILNGNVSSEKDRAIIERIARETRGVKDVRSNLIVNPSHVAVREGYNAPIASHQPLVSDITSRLASSPDLRVYDLKVIAVDNAVILRGEVGSEIERAAADRIARNTPGVTSVRNEIVLVSPRY